MVAAIAGMMLGLATSWGASTTTVLEAALASPTLRGAHVGALAVQADDGTLIYARNADDAFVPASTQKLLVGSAALALLGPTTTLRTDLETDGTIEGGTLHGNLYMRGGGDGTLAESDLENAAATLAALGVRHIDGALFADATRYNGPRYPRGWAIDDLANDYAPPIDALAINDDTVTIALAPGNVSGAPVRATVTPESSAFVIDNRATTGSAHSPDTTTLERVWDAPTTIRIVGSLPLDATAPVELAAAVPDPLAFALDRLNAHFIAHGMMGAQARGERTIPSNAHVLWSHTSASLATIVGDCWRPSDNLLAEMLLEELGSNDGAVADTREAGIVRERMWLQSLGVDPAIMTIADGSGVSQYDRLTPRDLVTVLAADWHGPLHDATIAALPVAGESGTLQHAFVDPPLAGNLIAKTGTLLHARALAGYLTTQHHGTIIFAFIVNDWMHDEDAHGVDDLRAAQARFLSAIATAS